MKQEEEQHKNAGQGGTTSLLPTAYADRVSMKWVTLEALRYVMQQSQQRMSHARAQFLTSMGVIEGDLVEIQPSYSESFFPDSNQRGFEPDITSLVVHLRTDILRSMEKQNKNLQIVDTAPLVSLKNVEMRIGARRQKINQITLFADQVIGFTVMAGRHVH